ncbi:MAG: hypothetical protein ACK55Z_16890, partial [bacterium]
CRTEIGRQAQQASSADCGCTGRHLPTGREMRVPAEVKCIVLRRKRTFAFVTLSDVWQTARDDRARRREDHSRAAATAEVGAGRKPRALAALSAERPDQP